MDINQLNSIIFWALFKKGRENYNIIFKIDNLLNILNTLINMEGIEINFEINGEKWPVFTKRPETIFGVTFLVISAQHKRLMELVTDKQKSDIEKFLKKLKSVSKKEGVFTGTYAVNPANGKKIPIYTRNFADHGIVMVVPAHDLREKIFAEKQGIDVKLVIKENTYYPMADNAVLLTIISELNSFLKKNGLNFVLVGGFAKEAHYRTSRTHTDFDIYVSQEALNKVEKFCQYKKFFFEKKNPDHEHKWQNAFCAYEKEGPIFFDIFLLEEENGLYFDEIIKNEKFEWGDKSCLENKKLNGVEYAVPNKKLLEKIYQHHSRGILKAYGGDGIMVNSGKFDDLDSIKARGKIVDWLVKKGKAKRVTKFKLKD